MGVGAGIIRGAALLMTHHVVIVSMVLHLTVGALVRMV